MQPFDIDDIVLSTEDWMVVSSAFDMAVAEPVAPTWLQRGWNALTHASPAPRPRSEQDVLHNFVVQSRYLGRPAYDLWPALNVQGFTSEQIGALAALAIH